MKIVPIFQSRQGLLCGLVVAALLLSPTLALAKKQKKTAEVKTQMVVTVVPHSRDAAQIPMIPKSSVSVEEDGKPTQMVDWKPLAASDGTQLVILIDDSLQVWASLYFKDINNFISQLPASTQVALGYMQYGSTVIAAGFTADHGKIMKVIHIPSEPAGSNASPYFCLSDLVHHWPAGKPAAVRQVLMVTDGIDRYFEGSHYDPEDPYVLAAIRDAQKQRVIVSSIYFRDSGDVGTSFMGGNYLRDVADGTGGKMYYAKIGNPITFTPFLKDYKNRLADTFLLTFLAHGSGLQNVKVLSGEQGSKLESPARVVVGQKILKPSVTTQRKTKGIVDRKLSLQGNVRQGNA